VEFEELVRLMRAFVQLSAERGKPLKRFLAEYTDGSVCDVSADLLRTIATTGAAPGPTRQPSADRGPQTIPEAIQHALFLRDCRLTSGKLVADVQENWGGRGWDDASIGVEASRMVQKGTLAHHKEDPGDGRGKGYGLTTWDAPDATNAGG
jgi:hypothetical protein